MIDWIIHILGGYTSAEMNSEKIKNLMAQAELIDAHQKELNEVKRVLLSGHPVLYGRTKPYEKLAD